MKSKYIDLVKDRFNDIIYDHVCYEYPDIEKIQVEKVMNLDAYDVSPRMVIYIQSLANAWNHMLFVVDTNNTYDCISVDDLCLYNKICVGNMYARAGKIKKDGVNVMSSTSNEESAKPVAGAVFRAVFDHNFATPQERACNLYCDILRGNLFEHGNECVARLMANCYLMLNGAGYISIPEDYIPMIKERAESLVSTGSRKQLCNYLLRHAVIGG